MKLKHDHNCCVRHSADIPELILSHMYYSFLCKYFDSMLILCNTFVELEHFILFNNFYKYHNLIYYWINLK